MKIVLWTWLDCEWLGIILRFRLQHSICAFELLSSLGRENPFIVLSKSTCCYFRTAFKLLLGIEIGSERSLLTDAIHPRRGFTWCAVERRGR